MRRTIFFLWFCLWPLLLGVFLPYFEFPRRLHLVNLFWGTVYGLGLWAIDKTVGLSIQSRLVVLASLVWPVLISAAMSVFGWNLPKMSHRMRLVSMSALLMSSLLTANLDGVLAKCLPTYYRLMSVIW